MLNAVTIWGHTLEHIASAVSFGNPVSAYRVTTEEGYWIRKATFPENVWKTVTFIYEDDDFSAIQIVATADLPEGAEQCGDVTTEPEPEVQ